MTLDARNLEILKLIHSAPFTYRGLATLLGVSLGQVQRRLLKMEKLEYLRRKDGKSFELTQAGVDAVSDPAKIAEKGD